MTDKNIEVTDLYETKVYYTKGRFNEELYNEYIQKSNKNQSKKKSIPEPNSHPNTVGNTNPSNTMPDTTKYSNVETKPFEMDKPPFDGLEPKELL